MKRTLIMQAIIAAPFVAHAQADPLERENIAANRAATAGYRSEINELRQIVARLVQQQNHEITCKQKNAVYLPDHERADKQGCVPIK